MKKIAAVVLFSVILSLACGDDNPTAPDEPLKGTWELTPLEDETAELMAMYLADSVVAPLGLYNEIKADLDLIREQLGDSIEIWDDPIEADLWPLGTDFEIGFYFYWKESRLIVWFDSVAVHKAVLFGSHDAWNELADSLRIDSVVDMSHGDNLWVVAYFHGRLNARKVQPYFSDFPGVMGSFPWLLGDVESIIMPFYEGDMHKYFFDFHRPFSIHTKICYIMVQDDSVFV